ncbi:solute carrier family 22 member 15-like [Tubulanus polymorphus]|uniref:solute carrier family 22 member 15-like n=1 Tax=Tubulanus polymorphus TaxID=672921 RepID=UPI003DA68731
MAGLFFGAMTSGYVADWIGRKKVLIAFASLMIATQIVVGFSNTWVTYLIIRAFTGFFNGGALNVCFTLPIEFVGPKWRTFCACFVLYALGSSLTSAAAYLTRDWRHTAFITASFGIPLIPAIILFGRRRSFFVYMLIPITCMVTMVIVGALNKKDELGIFTTLLVLIGNSGISSCWTLASIYSAEIYATVIRNIGCAAGSMGARIGGVIAPQIAFLGLISHWVIPYVLYAFLAITTTLFVFTWLPETNKEDLKDALREHDDSTNNELIQSVMNGDTIADRTCDIETDCI